MVNNGDDSDRGCPWTLGGPPVGWNDRGWPPLPPPPPWTGHTNVESSSHADLHIFSHVNMPEIRRRLTASIWGSQGSRQRLSSRDSVRSQLPAPEIPRGHLGSVARLSPRLWPRESVRDIYPSFHLGQGGDRSAPCSPSVRGRFIRHSFLHRQRGPSLVRLYGGAPSELNSGIFPLSVTHKIPMHLPGKGISQTCCHMVLMPSRHMAAKMPTNFPEL